MDSVLFDGRQHYLKLATGEVLSLTAELGKTPAAPADKTYAPARLAQLVLANLERRIFSVSAALRAKLQKLANRAAPPAHLQSESDIIMATSKKAPSKSTASKKAAPTKAASKKAAPVKAPSKKAVPTKTTKTTKAAPEAVTSTKGRVLKTYIVSAVEKAKRGDLKVFVEAAAQLESFDKNTLFAEASKRIAGFTKERSDRYTIWCANHGIFATTAA